LWWKPPATSPEVISLRKCWSLRFCHSFSALGFTIAQIYIDLQSFLIDSSSKHFLVMETDVCTTGGEKDKRARDRGAG